MCLFFLCFLNDYISYTQARLSSFRTRALFSLVNWASIPLTAKGKRVLHVRVNHFCESQASLFLVLLLLSPWETPSLSLGAGFNENRSHLSAEAACRGSALSLTRGSSPADAACLWTVSSDDTSQAIDPIKRAALPDLPLLWPLIKIKRLFFQTILFVFSWRIPGGIERMSLWLFPHRR